MDRSFTSDIYLRTIEKAIERPFRNQNERGETLLGYYQTVTLDRRRIQEAFPDSCSLYIGGFYEIVCKDDDWY
jgi:hypothetical protein